MTHVREKHKDVNENELNLRGKQPKIFEFASSKFAAEYKPGNIRQKQGNTQGGLKCWVLVH